MTTHTHENFFTIQAGSNFELGFLMGRKFSGRTRQLIQEAAAQSDWKSKLKRAEEYLEITEQYFPWYIDEIRGYAAGAHVDTMDLWTMSLENELDPIIEDKCTTIITNNGALLSHNEDWDENAADHICVLLKKINDTTILELYYFDTLGGNAISINSHGFVVAVNALKPSHKQPGIPRDIIARWISETKDIERDFKKLEKMPHSFGFSFNSINKDRKIWNIEYNSQKAILTQPSSPYVHTNHYLSELKSYDTNNNSTGSFDRYEVARAKVKPHMTVAELAEVTNDTSRGDEISIMNNRTLAKIIVDVDNALVKIWLRRERDKGWVDYPMSFIQ